MRARRTTHNGEAIFPVPKSKSQSPTRRSLNPQQRNQQGKRRLAFAAFLLLSILYLFLPLTADVDVGVRARPPSQSFIIRRGAGCLALLVSGDVVFDLCNPADPGARWHILSSSSSSSPSGQGGNRIVSAHNGMCLQWNGSPPGYKLGSPSAEESNDATLTVEPCTDERDNDANGRRQSWWHDSKTALSGNETDRVDGRYTHPRVRSGRVCLTAPTHALLPSAHDDGASNNGAAAPPRTSRLVAPRLCDESERVSNPWRQLQSWYIVPSERAQRAFACVGKHAAVCVQNVRAVYPSSPIVRSDMPAEMEKLIQAMDGIEEAVVLSATSMLTSESDLDWLSEVLEANPDLAAAGGCIIGPPDGAGQRTLHRPMYTAVVVRSVTADGGDSDKENGNNNIDDPSVEWVAGHRSLTTALPNNGGKQCGVYDRIPMPALVRAKDLRALLEASSSSAWAPRGGGGWTHPERHFVSTIPASARGKPARRLAGCVRFVSENDAFAGPDVSLLRPPGVSDAVVHALTAAWSESSPCWAHGSNEKNVLFWRIFRVVAAAMSGEGAGFMLDWGAMLQLFKLGTLAPWDHDLDFVVSRTRTSINTALAAEAARGGTGANSKKDEATSGVWAWERERPLCKGCGARPGECWTACRGKAGFCSSCDGDYGTKGACCQNSTDAGPAECSRTMTPLTHGGEYHECVLVEDRNSSEAWKHCGWTRHIRNILENNVADHLQKTRSGCTKILGKLQALSRVPFPLPTLQKEFCMVQNNSVVFGAKESWDTCMQKMQEAYAKMHQKGNMKLTTLLQVDLGLKDGFSSFSSKSLLIEASGPVGSGKMYRSLSDGRVRGNVEDDTDAFLVPVPYNAAVRDLTAQNMIDVQYGASWMQDPMDCPWRWPLKYK